MKQLCLFIFTALVATLATAQKGINSMYSAYGIGDVQLRDYNGYNGMGSLGTAMPSVITLNELNPASYGSLPVSRLILELSFTGKSVTYTNETQRFNAGDFGIKKGAIGFSLFKNWGTSFGLRRYSSVDYMTSGTRYLIGTDSKLTSVIDGTGGLNQYFFSNGVRIKKHLNLGASITYLSGSVNRLETVSTNDATTLKVDKNTYYGQFVFNTGAQYQFKTGKWNWIAGATYQPQRTLNKTEDNSVKDASGNILVQDKSVNSTFKYPAIWSGGLTMYNDTWRVGVDYIGQDWSQVKYSGDGFSTTTAGNLAVGLSHSKPKRTMWGYVDGPTWSVGFNMDRSYLILDGNQVTAYAGTVGVTLPSANRFYHYNAALKIGQRGSKVYPLVKESFVELNLNFNLATIMFVGGRKYD